MEGAVSIFKAEQSVVLGGSMYVSSRLATGRVFAVALAIILWGLGVPALKAAAAQQSCPPEQTQACPVDPHAQHEAEEAKERALAKQQKEAEHAQHEAEEAKAREQKEAEHAQHEAAEACARQQKKAEHAQHEAEEARDRAAAKEATARGLSGNMCKSGEPVAEEQPVPPPEPEIMRSKPTPSVPESTPEPMPEPTPPKELPKTASPLSLIGLIGLVSMTGGYLTRFFRR